MCICLNPAIDRTILIPGFTPGATNRAVQARLDPGGKGINVARVLKALGASVQVTGFIGENNGHLIRRHLVQAGIAANLISVPGDTRVNLKVIDSDTKELTEISDLGFTVAPEHLEQLLASVQQALADTSLLVLAGSLPTGVPVAVYRDLVRLASAAGVPTIVDADGEAMAHALRAHPTLIKPNRSETENLVGRRLSTRAQVLAAAAELLALGPAMVAISSGSEGAALVTAAGGWWATPPAIEANSPVGAGDSMVAGLALGLTEGLPPQESLRLATAAGAATATLEGTQLCSRSDLTNLIPQITVLPVRVGGKELEP